MYFALIILVALAVIVLVFLLEHQGDPRMLEREYHKRQSFTNKGDLS